MPDQRRIDTDKLATILFNMEHDANCNWLVTHAEVAALIREVLASRKLCATIIEAWDDGAGLLDVEHTQGPELPWSKPVCGDDHDACTRETCPAIWVINDAAKLAEGKLP